MRIHLPDNVKFIIKTLQENGYEAFAVGGCVRDSILGRIPEDWDITTSAKPEQTKALFRRTIDTGIEHGTVTIMLGKEGYEVTTYRIDGAYEDSRHPKEVSFTTNLEEDLKRRDFTINAMAYNDVVGIVDIFGGLADIEDRTIRAVGEARERFSEDALRILRAVRFAAQLDYRIENITFEAIKEFAPKLVNISAERIHTELSKLLLSKYPEIISIADESRILDYVMKEYSNLSIEEKKKTLKALKIATDEEFIFEKKETLSLRMAILMHRFAGKEEKGEEILRRLKLDNETISYVKRLVKYYDTELLEEPAYIRRLVVECGQDLMELLFAIKKCISLAEPEAKEGIEKIDRVRNIYYKILDAGDCINMKDMMLSGNDLIKAGMQPGRQMGQVLNYLFSEVLKDPEKNNKDILLEMAFNYDKE